MDNRAKELFFVYSGNHSAMANDGVYEEYKSYGVSKEQEEIWKKGFNADVVEKLAVSENFRIDFVKACNFVRKSKDSDKLDCLFDYLFSAKADSCGISEKLQMAEAFADTAIRLDSGLSKRKYLSQLYNFCVSLKNSSATSDEMKRADFIAEKINNV